MMSSVTALSGSSYSVTIGNTLSIGVRPGASGSSSSSTSGGSKAVTAQQGAAAVTAALKQSTAIFTALSSLQDQIQKAGTNPDKATAKALSDNIVKVAKQIDQLAASAKTSGVNLLSNTNSSISVATASGLKVDIAAQALDSKALGLDKLTVTDAATLRAATGKVAQALGQTQLTVFRLQTADGAVGTTTAASASNPASTAYGTALSNQSAGVSSNTATAAVEKALNSQIAANATSYDSYGAAATGATSIPSFLNLFA